MIGHKGVSSFLIGWFYLISVSSHLGLRKYSFLKRIRTPPPTPVAVGAFASEEKDWPLTFAAETRVEVSNGKSKLNIADENLYFASDDTRMKDKCCLTPAHSQACSCQCWCFDVGHLVETSVHPVEALLEVPHRSESSPWTFTLGVAVVFDDASVVCFAASCRTSVDGTVRPVRVCAECC